MRRWLVAAMVFTVVANACAGAAPQAAAQPDPNAEIRFASDEDTWPGEGEKEKSKLFAYPLNMNVFEPLIYLGSDYSLKPGLAERWELIQPNTWRFHIRKGVKFHDGSPLTADDVVWTWGDRQLKGQALSTVTNTLDANSVKKIDEFTVDITPKVPNLRLPEQIVHPNGSIMPKGKHPDEPGTPGTGPFKVVEYRRADSATFERNEAYWGEKPKVKRIVVRFLPDPQARIQALKAGDVDFIKDAPPDAVRSLESAGLTVVRSKPGRNQMFYLYRNGKAPNDLLTDKSIRQAVSLSIDRKTYAETVFDGNADPGRAMAPASILGKFAELVAAPVYDPAKAKSVLDAAGWKAGASGIREKSGRALKLEMIAWAEVSSTALELLQSQLKAVGIDVVIKKAADQPTYSGFYRGNAFDLDLEVPNQNDGNPAFLPVLRMYSKATGTERFAPGGEFDTWAAKALAAPTTEGVQEASAQMMRILIHEEFTVVPLAGLYRIYAMRKGVSLGDPHPSATNQTWISLTASK